MSVASAKTIIVGDKKIKGVFLIYETDDKSVTQEALPLGTQKKVEFKLRFKVENKTAERKVTIYAKTYKGAIKEAISRREDFINQLRNGKLEEIRIKKLTLNEAMEEFLNYKKELVKAFTLNSYDQIYKKWIKPKLGNKILKNITVRDLQIIVNTMLQKGLAPRTTQSIQQVMRPLFKYYEHQGVITGNPASLIQIPKFDNAMQVSLKKSEIDALYKAINSYPIEPFHTLFMWLAEGRRLNELLSLEWSGIDFENHIYFIVSTKNKAGVTMQYRLRDNIYEALTHFDKKSSYIFHSINDPSKKMSNGTVRGHWKKLLKNADIEHLRIHDLRHILGSDLVSNNHTLEEVAQVLGHTSTHVTKRYSTVRQNKTNEALDSFFDRIDNIL